MVVVKSSNDISNPSCLGVFNKIIRYIIEAKADFCHAITPKFFLLDSTEGDDYLTANNQFAMSDIQKALSLSLAQTQQVVLSVNGKGQMNLSKILYLQKLTHWYHLFPMDFFTVAIQLS